MSAAMSVQIGSDAMMVVASLPRIISDLEQLEFVRYAPAPGVRARLSKMTNQLQVSDRIRSLLKHDAESGPIAIGASKISRNYVLELAANTPTGEVLGLRSQCIVNGRLRHIPMMDFSAPVTSASETMICEAMKQLLTFPGALLVSGQSYHYYGFGYLSTELWIEFMARCILLDELVDARYIGHRLAAGTGILRISSNAVKPVGPHVVRVI